MVSADVAIPISSALVIFLARMKELGTKRAILPGPVQERRTYHWFLLAGGVLLVGGVVEFFWRAQRVSWGMVGAGWSCAVISFALRHWARTSLGKFWSLHVEIRENHEFVRNGPFRWVRHPTYLSMILELVGGGLLLGAYYTLTLAGLIFVPTLIVRLRLEESALVGKFGAAYQAYQRQTPALLPHKWPRSP